MKVSSDYAESVRQGIGPWTHDISGKPQGRLTWLYPTTERDGSSVKWIARCSCGNLTICVPKKVVKSCGCLMAEEKRQSRGISYELFLEIKGETGKLSYVAKKFGVAVSTVFVIRNGLHFHSNKKAAVC